MDKELMAFGAFLLVLGVMLVWAVPTLFSLQIAGYASPRITDPSEWVLAGMVIAPFGGGILAFGIGRDVSPKKEQGSS